MIQSLHIYIYTQTHDPFAGIEQMLLEKHNPNQEGDDHDDHFRRFFGLMKRTSPEVSPSQGIGGF